MSNPAGPGEQVAWTVTSQTAQVGATENGSFLPGFKVSFRYGVNNTGDVFVPQSQYTPDNVALAVTAKVRAMVDVGRLSGMA